MGLLSERSEDDHEHGEINIMGLERLEGGDSDELVYDLDDWNEQARAALRDRLETLGVPHRWEEAALVTSAADEAWIERIMDQVEDDLLLTLDPEVAQIAYELADWDVSTRERLFDLLEADAVPYGIDGDELYVQEIDEQRVDELVERILDPAAPQRDGAGPDLMGELFVAADRLAHDPVDHEGTLTLIDVLRTAGTSAPPYGMDKVWWDGVISHADQLVVLLDSPASDLGGVADQAAQLRDQLRPYV